MLVIIEGPDKAGKTTLAKEITKRFGYCYSHFGAPGPDPGREYADFLCKLERPTVCDRFYIGEQVYGPLLRGKSLISNLQKAVLERLCRFRGAVLIYASTPLEVCQERLARSKDDDVTPVQNAIAWKMFQEIIKEIHIAPMCLYDSSRAESLDVLLAQIRPVLHTMHSLAGLAHIYCTGIGTIFGSKMVVVGESLNERVTWVGKPFDKGVSSEFLYSCMREAEIPEAKLYLCNADKLTVEESMFIRQGETLPWLALGELAHAKLQELRIDHTWIPHPQYWKRFHANEREEYVGMLKKWRFQWLGLSRAQ